MKKILNEVEDLLDESLRGFAQAHSAIVELNQAPRFIYRKASVPSEKVALVSGGGAGHEPLHSGLVGKGMLDAACPGQVFTSPTPDQMLAAAQQVEKGAGVLFIVKNYAGDVMNFEIAAEMLDCEHGTVLVQDDVSLPADHSTGRRGVAGTLIVEKMVGAAAEQGADLQSCKALGDRVAKMTASMGFALSSCTVPEAGRPTFELAEDQVEMGVGIHGERGHELVAHSDATTLVNQLNTAINEALQPKSGQQILLHVNGFGATPLIELYLVFDIAARYWRDKKVTLSRTLVGNFTTSLEMAGCSVTVTLLDEELIALWDAPVHTAALRWGC